VVPEVARNAASAINSFRYYEETTYLLKRLVLLYYHQAITKWRVQIKHGKCLYQTHIQNTHQALPQTANVNL